MLNREEKNILELNEYSDGQLKYSFGFSQKKIDNIREIAKILMEE